MTRRLCMCGCLLLILFANILAPWPVLHPSVAFAQALHYANPPLAAPAWLTASRPSKHPNLNKSISLAHAAPTGSGDPTQHRWPSARTHSTS
jgi:hypothetical protein